MQTQTQITEILRLLRNLVRIGTVAEVDLDQALCRVATGDNTTGWLNWLTLRAGQSRSWWAPSEGEQVLILSLGGELDTAFVLPGIFSDDFPPPSASADGLYIAFPDGATLHYEPESGELLADGIKTAVINAAESVTITAPNITCAASVKILLDTPEVECTNNLTTATLNVKSGGKMSGNIEHAGGQFSSNGVVVDNHNHGGVQRGGSYTEGIQ
ncbi:TPA: phage baseplate assembly protein V [Yersinia enterocolitica]|uniref:Baseplate assembly protein V n=1 Tax=Yersinia enterocolitica TaxID=630 RepID=A0A0H5HAG0_YEREN|nr:phage baseplate assembly protein V [Yersinia enterocolitica]EKN3327946.1 phage baseplate assembly protein V [Yersinia enterocolitica]EKN3331636.1 phage baseplate assembly protein V [Yersinia enterocolitica]EKN3352150.1 phage baseplate assembly protein V [Yersinia enterocolitica]EKN3359955.1 phage baseplate assembly protein V [Yersinia enterocolitica]EKN3367177.1 phage baseplate assembly protein V [Yersinia enterocolitica]